MLEAVSQLPCPPPHILYHASLITVEHMSETAKQTLQCISKYTITDNKNVCVFKVSIFFFFFYTHG